MELRFDLFLWFKGAIFLDAGNIWTLRKDPDRIGAQIHNKFYQDIAINTGLGLRLDVDFFILRFDFGLPLRNPYTDELGSHNYFQKNAKIKWGDFNPNIAIGYPF